MARMDPLIGGLFEVELARPLPQAGGGLEAYAASDRRMGRQGFVAVRVRDGESPRAQPLGALANAGTAGVLIPLAHGVAADASGTAGQFVICRSPPGPSLAALLARDGRPWSEAELLAAVLRPAAAALAELDGRHVTHRAIRADNVFQIERGQPIVLGCAWAGPPASLQPAVYEPVASAACLTHGRGDGSVADDVYALGVLLVVLASGAQPMAGLDPAAVVARKTAIGSFAALTEGIKLPPIIADLVRGMVAEDPDHRPSPLLLADPLTARARRVAARPMRRAQRPLEVGGIASADARGLAHALATRPDDGARALRSGAIDRWLRRGLGDPTLAQAVEEAVRNRAEDSLMDDRDADALMVLRAVAVLNPLAPPCWSGLVLAADGLGTALAAATPEQEEALCRLVEVEGLAAWARARPERSDPVLARLDARQHRLLLHGRGWTGGVARLRYTLNGLLACRAPHLRGTVVVRLSDVLPALERVAARADRPALPIDAELAAFLAARMDQRQEPALAGLGAVSGLAREGEAALAQLRVLAGLQDTMPSLAVPALAGWLAEECAPLAGGWRSRERLARARIALDQAAAGGRLGAMLAVVADPASRAQDAREHAAVQAGLQALDTRIAAAEALRAQARATARQLGQEIAAALGTIAAAAAIAVALL